ncbi:MAG: hypothetical protein ACJ8E3_06880 [Sphingomicrobium sp.]
MTDTGLVPLNCGSDALTALAAGLKSFGPTDGEPDWLVSGAWLCTADEQFLATPSIDVLADGYLARPLTLERPADVVAGLEAEMPDIEGRLVAHGSDIELPRPDIVPRPPARLSSWTGPYALSVLVRSTERAAVTHRVACALLFTAAAGNRLLVGTDPSAMALVLSKDSQLIAAYRSGCEDVPLLDYLAQVAG